MSEGKRDSRVVQAEGQSGGALCFDARRDDSFGPTSARFDTRAAHELDATAIQAGITCFMRNGQAPADQAAAQKSAPLYACAMLHLPLKWLDLPGILESECKNGRGAKPLKAVRRALILQNVVLALA